MTLKLNLPDRTSHSWQVNLISFPKNKFVMLVLGHIEECGASEVSFSVIETSKLYVKKGLVIKDTVIHPVPV